MTSPNQTSRPRPNSEKTTATLKVPRTCLPNYSRTRSTEHELRPCKRRPVRKSPPHYAGRPVSRRLDSVVSYAPASADRGRPSVSGLHRRMSSLCTFDCTGRWHAGASRTRAGPAGARVAVRPPRRTPVRPRPRPPSTGAQAEHESLGSTEPPLPGSIAAVLHHRTPSEAKGGCT